NDVVKQRVRWLVMGAVALWLSSMFYTVNEEEYGVVLRFGRPVKVCSAAGLGLKFPLPMDTVMRVDKRLLVFDSMATEYLTKDKKNIISQCYAVWRVTDPQQLLTRCGDRTSAEKKLDEHLYAALGDAFGNRSFDDLVNTDPKLVKVGELQQQVEKAVNDAVQQNKYGIEVQSVRILRMSYPDATLEAVFRRMRAERKTIAETYRAEGTRDSAKIRSEADLQKDKLLADAKQKADTIRGQAEQQAAAIYSRTYESHPEFWRYWRKLQAMEKVIDKNTTIYMTPDIEIFSPLTQAPPAH
ncbi:MAG: protease modulator HflC, partial [Armatimonadetes bacterium]|nr:protease modulator HflC [Armatimonadota bacterium]